MNVDTELIKPINNRLSNVGGFLHKPNDKTGITRIVAKVPEDFSLLPRNKKFTYTNYENYSNFSDNDWKAAKRGLIQDFNTRANIADGDYVVLERKSKLLKDSTVKTTFYLNGNQLDVCDQNMRLFTRIAKFLNVIKEKQGEFPQNVKPEENKEFLKNIIPKSISYSTQQKDAIAKLSRDNTRVTKVATRVLNSIQVAMEKYFDVRK